MTLTTKLNGDEITSSWFNDIKTEIEELDTDVTTRITAHEDDTTPHATISAASIEAPSRLDAKQDTEANLTTYASTAANGQMCFATDTKKMYQVIDSALAEVGGGGAGSLSTYKTLVADDNPYTDWDATGLVNATFGQEEVAPLNGDVSYLLTNVTGSVGEYIYSEAIDVPLKSRNKINSSKFPYNYDGDDADITVQIYDITNSVLLENALDVESSANGTISNGVYIPTSCESIKLKVTIAVENDGKKFVFDDLEFSDGMAVQNLMVEYDVVEKYLAANKTSTGTLPDLTLSDLVIGEKYTLTVFGSFYGSSTTTDNVSIDVTHTGQTMPTLQASTASLSSAKTKSLTHDFTATATTITFAAGSISSPSRVDGNGTVSKTHVQLIRKPTESEHVVHQVSTETWMETDTARFQTGNGYGSTNNKIRRFSQIAINDSGYTFGAIAASQTSPNGAFKVTDSAALGTEIEILKAGAYTFTRSDIRSDNFSTFGFSLNSTELTIPINSVTPTDVLSNGQAVVGYNGEVSWSGNLNVGDIVRPHDAGECDVSNTRTRFSVTASVPRAINSIIVSPVIRTAYIKDVKPSGTGGGTFTAGAWRTRTLNTLSGDTDFVSLEGTTTRFTLAPGKYDIDASAPAFIATVHKIKLVKDPGGTPSDEIIGTNEYNTTNTVTRSFLEGRLELTERTTFEIQHRCTSTHSLGFGVHTGFGVDEVFAQVKITKVS